MARQNPGQNQGKRFSATTTTAAIRTKDPLASAQAAAIVFDRIIAVEDAVPVQCLVSAAAWTALLLE